MNSKEDYFTKARSNAIACLAQIIPSIIFLGVFNKQGTIGVDLIVRPTGYGGIVTRRVGCKQIKIYKSCNKNYVVFKTELAFFFFRSGKNCRKNTIEKNGWQKNKFISLVEKKGRNGFSLTIDYIYATIYFYDIIRNTFFLHVKLNKFKQFLTIYLCMFN